MSYTLSCILIEEDKADGYLFCSPTLRVTTGDSSFFNVDNRDADSKSIRQWKYKEIETVQIYLFTASLNNSFYFYYFLEEVCAHKIFANNDLCPEYPCQEGDLFEISSSNKITLSVKRKRR